MNYYEIYDNLTGQLAAKGNAQECREQLGCASMDSFYALANRSLRGINKRYTVTKMKGGETDYPVLGENDPIHEYGAKILEPVTKHEERNVGV